MIQTEVNMNKNNIFKQNDLVQFQNNIWIVDKINYPKIILTRVDISCQPRYTYKYTIELELSHPLNQNELKIVESISYENNKYGKLYTVIKYTDPITGKSIYD